ncbi:MAG: hypothetical protein R6X03_07750 [Methyloceanibacter sp.]|jgi:hypothetical protein
MQSFAGGAGPTAAQRKGIAELAGLAVVGNFTSALKNMILIAPALYLALAGVEPMLIGFGPDGKLQGLLVHF